MSHIPSYRGVASLLTVLVLASLVVLGLLIALLVLNTRRSPDASVDELRVYCAAGMRFPMERIADDYKREYDVAVIIQYGGSHTLLSQILASQVGDLYVAADESYVALAKRKGVAAEVIPLAKMRPVIAARKDAVHEFKAVEDLITPCVVGNGHRERLPGRII